MCFITIYAVGLIVCVKNSVSNSYAMGNGWGKVGKFGFLVNILNFLLLFLQIVTLTRRFLDFFEVFELFYEIL